MVDMDLEKYFDTVNQSKLVEVLSRTIKDGRVISLIHKYLKAGVVVKHKFEETEVGVPQGGNLSPILEQHHAERTGQGTGKQRPPICPLCGRSAHLLQKQKKRRAYADEHSPFHREEAIPQSKSGENGRGRSEEGQISWILILHDKRGNESQNPSEIHCKDESQSQRAYFKKQWNGKRRPSR